MRTITWRAAGALIVAGALALPASASAHASVSPPTVVKEQGQLFAVAVPGEEENDTTVKVEVDFPPGFAVDSFEAEPGWTRQVQATGAGEEADIRSATWTGGKVPTGEDAVFRFVAEPAKAGDYTFGVKQTYASGKVVEWNGAESSDTPAAVVHVVDSIGGGGGSNTLAIIGIVVGAIGLLVGLAALLGRKRALA
jgi:uncharacterized protein YcnI